MRIQRDHLFPAAHELTAPFVVLIPMLCFITGTVLPIWDHNKIVAKNAEIGYN